MKQNKALSEFNRLEAKIKSLEDDRAKYRTFIKNEMQKQLQVIAENKYYQPKSIMERFISFIATVEPYQLWW
jgi:hypothetical protein